MIFLSCSNLVSPDGIDSRLVGTWYYTVDNSPSYASPQTYFFGIEILADGNVKELGIETNTGEVAITNNSYKKILKANFGELNWEYVVEGIGLVTETLNYKIENGKLIISKGNLDYIYTRTNLATRLFEPVTSEVAFKKDSILYENRKISGYPSGYASISSDFFLRSEMNHAYLTIEINNFKGIGSYEIPYNKFEFAQYHGDVGLIYVPDSLSTGNLTITSYDEINNTCSGTFYLNEPVPDNPDSTITSFKEGIFTVPVYK